MNAQRSRTFSATPEQLYEHLLAFWRMHLAVEEPDVAQLRELHRALCNQEALLCEHHLNRCMQNLVQRLQDVRSLGIQLLIPTWVTAQLQDLTQWAEEEKPLREAKP
jgi:hypothetical protein